MRERVWNAVAWSFWSLLTLLSGGWTLISLFFVLLHVFSENDTMEKGYAAVFWEYVAVVSIPIYCLFFGLIAGLLLGFSQGKKPPMKTQGD